MTNEGNNFPKHTPAPWTLEDHESEPCQLIGNGTIHIADIYMTDFPAARADAQLIAAAPDLYKALNRSLVFIPHRIIDGNHYAPDCERCAAEETIRKARGEQ